MIKKCYLCNSTENLTKDHVPPKGFFPPENRKNLITLDCCESCHRKLALDDEAVRIFFSSIISRSKEGEWIWKEKVLKSSFKRSPKLKYNVKKNIIKTNVLDKDGNNYHAISFPQERMEKFLIRITKGLMGYHYPKINTSNKNIDIIQITPTQDLIDNTLSKFKYAEVGNGVFRYWRIRDDSNYIWVYVFYDGAMFMAEIK